MGTWIFEPGHTAAEFRARHMMVTWVRGLFKDVRGTVEFDRDRFMDTTFEGRMDATRLWSGEPDRDAHLRSADFFDVENHPWIEFGGRFTERTGASHFKAEADLTIRGVTRGVPLDVAWLGEWRTPFWEGDENRGEMRRIGFEATTRLNRHDFGVSWQDEIPGGGVVAGNAIDIVVDVEAILRDDLEATGAIEYYRAIRAACPGVPLGLTTGLWTTDGDAELRHAQVEAWEDLPDYVSVNLAEPGSAELCALMARRGVGVEAGVWNLADAQLLLERGLAPLRVLVETSDGGAEDPVVAAAEIDEMLVARGVSAPQLHHGAGSDAWMVLDAALARGRDVRIGLEDTTLLPDGRTARDNAELVAEAARRHRA